MIILFLLAAALLLTLLICLYCFHTCFYSPPHRRCGPEDPMLGKQFEAVQEHITRISRIMGKIPYEEVTIISFDGLTLYGRYYHLRDGAPLEILFHGYRSHPYRDCSGGHALARKMGFNTLVVDQRAHGNSGGTVICFGIKERFDVLSWVQYANGRFGSVPTLLCGLSMGAATVLMAAGLELPENVSAIIADSPYSSPSAIIEKVCADLHYPVALCRPFIRLGARLFGNLRLKQTSAKEAVRRSQIPILLLHGEADRFVPCPMSLEIAACCGGPVKVRTFPGAGHGLSYLTDPLGYEREVYRFLRQLPEIGPQILESFVQQLYP